MANHLLSFRPAGIHPCAIPGYRKLDSDRRRSSTSSSSSYSWSTTLCALSSESDSKKKRQGASSEADPGQISARSKFSPGRLTEDKARQLRVMTNKTSTFHDIMYHSAIASRLASDFKDAL